MEEEIRDLLAERCGIVPSAMEAKIAEWEAWWRGHDPSFHEFYEQTPGGQAVCRSLYRMNMAKKVCEDWASLLLNDRTVLHVDDAEGEAFVQEVFERTDFRTMANRLVEKAFAVGTGAAILRLSGLLREEDGTLTAAAGTSVSFDFVDAAHIFPVSVQNGIIREAVFISEGMRRGEETVYLEFHTREEDGYVIRNEFYVRENGVLQKKSLPGCEEELHTGAAGPLFAVLSPNIQNPYDERGGLGVSVFDAALDCLRGVDLAFNNFCRDLRLGGKKVFLHQSLLARDETGRVFTPDDVAQQLFVPLGDSDFADHPMIMEHNPDLRTAENAEAVQAQLNYISFRCGLGTHHYRFNEQRGTAHLTATQYMGERQDMRQNAGKHQKKVAAFLVGVVRALLWCARDVFGLSVDPEARVQVLFDDSYFSDSDTRRRLELEEIEAGVRTVDEYRRDWLGGVNGRAAE